MDTGDRPLDCMTGRDLQLLREWAGSEQADAMVRYCDEAIAGLDRVNRRDQTERETAWIRGRIAQAELFRSLRQRILSKRDVRASTAHDSAEGG